MPQVTVKQEFSVGDAVIAVAFTDCFGVFQPETRGLKITDVRLHTWIELGVDRSYYRYTARGDGWEMVEGAARFFAPADDDSRVARALRMTEVL